MNTAEKIEKQTLTRDEIYNLLRKVIIGEQSYTYFYSPTLGEYIGLYRKNPPANLANKIWTWYSIEEMKLALRMNPQQLKRYHYFKKELIG